ncbi:ABC transporter substrate-binding protein [Pseudonocardia nigra]|uniref:ABC transporter substrate-binding protein n=1 Tax=Pseudonocardia nigra TaxID=1921578 RepID=UPI001C5D5294|nr:ABC transporter substrate-binding protein [Pseudonocardia nigra]
MLGANAQTSVLGARAGAEAINEAGGIGGRPVEITVVDDGGDATVAVTKLREAIASDARPDAYMNSGPSNLAAATLPILTQNEILSFNIGPTENSADPAVFPLNFDLSPSPQDMISGFVAHIRENGHGSVGIIHGSSAYGETFGTVAEEGLSAAGIDVVGTEEYDVAALDMTPQLQALRARNPQALVVDGYGAPLGYLLQSMEKLGWEIPLLGNTSVSATGLVSTEPPAGLLGTPLVEPLLMQVYTSTAYDPAAEKVNRMVERMTALGPIPASLILAYNYDAFFLLAAAARDAGSTEAAALAAALEKPEVQRDAGTAVLPLYNFTASAHAPQVGADALTFVAPSKVVNGQFATPVP